VRREKRKDEKGGRRRERKNRSLSLFSLSLFPNLTSGSTARALATTLASSDVAKVTRASLCFLVGKREEGGRG
jgi:hypothetical protein